MNTEAKLKKSAAYKKKIVNKETDVRLQKSIKFIL